MRRDRTVSGITSGVVAASATAGALLGFGFRLGAPARPFNATAAMLLGPNALATPGFSPGATTVGIVLHVAMMLGWGLLYASLVDRSGSHPVAWAAIVAAAAIATLSLVARLFGVGPATFLPSLALLALCVVLAIALAIGMRIAFPKV